MATGTNDASEEHAKNALYGIRTSDPNKEPA